MCSCSFDGIPIVDIDPSGVFKYLLVKVHDKEKRGNKKTVTIVRGYQRHDYHSDIYDELEEILSPLNLEPLGGGRLVHKPDIKRIELYGYSKGFGKADHKIAAKLLKEAYPNYRVVISNDGMEGWVSPTPATKEPSIISDDDIHCHIITDESGNTRCFSACGVIDFEEQRKFTFSEMLGSMADVEVTHTLSHLVKSQSSTTANNLSNTDLKYATKISAALKQPKKCPMCQKSKGGENYSSSVIHEEPNHGEKPFLCPAIARRMTNKKQSNPNGAVQFPSTVIFKSRKIAHQSEHFDVHDN